MTLATIDDLWFRAHPGRQFRLRPVPAHESAHWLKPPGPERNGYCIVRRSDGAHEECSVAKPNTLDDYDDELEPVFNQLRREPA